MPCRLQLHGGFVIRDFYFVMDRSSGGTPAEGAQMAILVRRKYMGVSCRSVQQG